MKVEIQSEVVKRVLTDAYTKASTVMNKMDVCDDKMRLADAVAGISGVLSLVERAEDNEECFQALPEEVYQDLRKWLKV